MGEFYDRHKVTKLEVTRAKKIEQDCKCDSVAENLPGCRFYVQHPKGRRRNRRRKPPLPVSLLKKFNLWVIIFRQEN